MEHTKHTHYYCQKCELAVIVLPNQDPIKACKCEAPIIAKIAATVIRNESFTGVING